MKVKVPRAQERGTAHPITIRLWVYCMWKSHFSIFVKLQPSASPEKHFVLNVCLSNDWNWYTFLMKVRQKKCWAPIWFNSWEEAQRKGQIKEGIDKRKWVFRTRLAIIGENASEEAWEAGGWSQGGVEGYPEEPQEHVGAESTFGRWWCIFWQTDE